MKLLSIIVPVYNMAADGKLNYCMDSLVGQTIDNYEIITVDDASTDDSLEVLNGYASKYPDKVKVIHYDDNRRQGGAKNEGLRHASGEWIGFIDSDDWVTPDYYEKLIKKAEETGADIVGCDYNLVTEHTMQVGKVVKNNSREQTGPIDDEKSKLLLMRPGSMVIKIYKHNVIKENNLNFPEHIFYEDNCAGPLWMMYFKHFEKLDEPMYYYYQHNSSTVHYISEDKCNDRMAAAALLLEECKRRGLLEKYRDEIEYRFVELYYVITLFSYMQGARRRKLTYVRKMREYAAAQFPDFQENRYYNQYTGEEEKKWIALQMKSDFLFYWYYLVKLTVRNYKKRLRK